MFVVCVDPNRPRQEAIAAFFRKRHHQVLCFQTAAAAWEHISQLLPDVLLIHCEAPDEATFNLVKQTHHLSRHCTIVAYGAEFPVEDLIRFMQLGVSDYVEEPVSIEKLLVRTRYAWLRRRLQSPPIMGPSRLRLEWDTHHPLNLTPTDLTLHLLRGGYVWDFQEVYQVLNNTERAN